MAERNTRIRYNQIASVRPDDLDSTNVLGSAMDNYVPSYDLATGKFTWVESGGGVTADDVDDFTIKYENNKLKVADRIEDNIMLNAFRIAVNGALTQFGMVEGILDEFEDESGIDNASSSNESYDSTDDYYSPEQSSNLELDYMEYSDDASAQSAWASSDPTDAGEIDSNTRLMLHGNGVDGSKEILDEGNTGHIVTQNGTAQLDAGYFNNACYFDGSGDYLTIPDSNDWDVFGSNSDNWTIDLWAKHESGGSAFQHIIKHHEDSNNWWSLYLENHNWLYWQCMTGGSGVVTVGATSSTYFTDSRWHHIALIKVADEYGIYYDGTQIAYVQDSSTDTFAGSLYIGYANDGSSYWKGKLDEIRIIKSNPFSASPNSTPNDTITVPTSAHTSDSDTKLLLHFDGNLTDSGNTGHTVTDYGNAGTTGKWGRSGLLLDGDSDYLTIPDSDDWDLCGSASDTWTIDLWVRHHDHSGDEVYLSQWQDADNQWRLYHTNGTGLQFYMDTGGGGSEISFSGGEITDTDWHHVALIKVEDDWAIYLDGTRVANATDNSTATFSGSLYIGCIGNPAFFFDGYMDEIRITKSNPFNADPTSANSITVPTGEHTSDANTKLLLHCDTQDEVLHGYHIPEFNGTMQLDTAVKKWGTGAFLFDGDSDYIKIPDSSDWDICGSNSDNWTIDFWVKHTDHAGSERYITHYEDGNNRWVLYHQHGSGIRFYFVSGGVSKIDTDNPNNGEITDTDWHHIALCKVGNEYGIYLDGNQVEYATTNDTDTFSGYLYIGQTGDGSTYFDGSMDEIRIQHSNSFSASPQNDDSDTITVPTSEYATTGVGSLQCYSEDTIKNQGSYSLKGISDTDALNETLTKTLGSGEHLDLSGYHTIKFDVYSSRTGTNLRLKIHDSGGTTSTKDITIGSGEADAWKTISWDISGIADANKDDIDSIVLEVINADAGDTFYIDNIYAEGITQNMILISNTFTTEANPETARIVIFEEDVDSITENIDIKAYVSRDGGTTWGQVTLDEKTRSSVSKRILSGTIDLTQSGLGAGSSVEYKITTHNNKDLKLHGVGLTTDQPIDEIGDFSWVSGVTNLVDLEDVNTSSLSDGDGIYYDASSSKFVNRQPLYAEGMGIRGFEVVYNTTTSVIVNAGVLTHGNTRVVKTSNTTLTLSTASHWWDGSVDSYSGGDGWCYIGVDSSGNIKFLGANPPNKADTSGNTDGTKYYWYDSSKYWRVIFAIRVNTDDEIEFEFKQNEDTVMIEHVDVKTTAGSENVDCSSAIPAISELGIFGAYVAKRSTSAYVRLRPKGTTWTLNSNCDGIYIFDGEGTEGNEPAVAGELTCITDSNQEIYVLTDTSNGSPGHNCGICVKGYVLNIR